MGSKFAMSVVAAILSVTGSVVMFFQPIIAQVTGVVEPVGDWTQFGIGGMLGIVAVVSIITAYKQSIRLSKDNLEGNRLIAAAIVRGNEGTHKILREALNVQRSQKRQDARLSGHDKKIGDLEDRSGLEKE